MLTALRIQMLYVSALYVLGGFYFTHWDCLQASMAKISCFTGSVYMIKRARRVNRGKVSSSPAPNPYHAEFSYFQPLPPSACLLSTALARQGVEIAKFEHFELGKCRM